MTLADAFDFACVLRHHVHGVPAKHDIHYRVVDRCLRAWLDRTTTGTLLPYNHGMTICTSADPLLSCMLLAALCPFNTYLSGWSCLPCPAGQFQFPRLPC